MWYSVFLVLISVFACSSSETVEKIEKVFENGSPKIVRYYNEGQKGSKILVKEKMYYKNGQLRSEGSFKNSKRDGKWTYYYENGKKWAEASYDKGLENGIKTIWHPNGQKHFEGTMKDGERVGAWIFWNKYGVVDIKINYD